MPGQALTSLDPLETPVGELQQTPCGPKNELPDDPAPPWRHRGWAKTRNRIRAAMIDAHLPYHRLAAWDACGADYWLLRNRKDPTLYKIIPDTCKNRLCVPCQRERAVHLATNVAKAVGSDPIRFVTLTLRSSEAPLREQLSRLLLSFRRLRQTPLWKQRVTGGAAFLELTLNHTSLLWHPHLHVLVQGSYLPQPLVKAQWMQITGDSHIVDIRLCRDTKTAAQYVTKYAAKPYDHQVTFDSHQLLELVQALAHRKTVITFGTWRKLKLLAKDTDPDWELICHSAEIRFHAACGNSKANQALAETLTRWSTGDLTPFQWATGPPPRPFAVESGE